MKHVLVNRIVFVTAVFASFAYVLKRLIEVENTSWDIAYLAMLICTAVSLTLSLFFIPRIKVKKMFIWGIVCLTLLFSSVYLFYRFQITFIQNTAIIEEFSGDLTVKNTYFIGTKFTPQAINTIKNKPELEHNKEKLLEEHAFNINDVWDPDSIRMNELNLSLKYFAFVILLTSCLSIVTEIIAKRQRPRAGQRPPES